jgi:hypothetical protein
LEQLKNIVLETVSKEQPKMAERNHEGNENRQGSEQNKQMDGIKNEPGLDHGSSKAPRVTFEGSESKPS